MIQTVTISTTPSYISGDLKAPMGGSVFFKGDSDWLGMVVELQVSTTDVEDEGGVDYVSAGLATKKCSLVIPWGSKRVRFVTLHGPGGALAAPVAICDLRT